MSNQKVEKTEQEKEELLINKLKKIHKVDSIYVVEVPCDDKGKEVKKAYLKRPDRQILSAISQFQNDQIKASEILLNSCWLDGDEEIKTDDDLFFSALTSLEELIKIRQSSIKKK